MAFGCLALCVFIIYSLFLTFHGAFEFIGGIVLVPDFNLIYLFLIIVFFHKVFINDSWFYSQKKRMLDSPTDCVTCKLLIPVAHWLLVTSERNMAIVIYELSRGNTLQLNFLYGVLFIS